MGIGYSDSIVVYNRTVEGVMETETYYGTRFDNVRIELTQGSRIAATGNESADACIVKIPKELTGAYLPPGQWAQLPAAEKLKHFTLDKDNKTFFAITKKELLGIDVKLPTGSINSEEYAGGLYQCISSKCGYAYMLNHVDIYELIPRLEIGGS